MADPCLINPVPGVHLEIVEKMLYKLVVIRFLFFDQT